MDSKITVSCNFINVATVYGEAWGEWTAKAVSVFPS